MQASVVRHEGETLERQVAKPIFHCLDIKDAMCIEAHALMPDRRREIKPSARNDNTLQFVDRLACTFWIDRIAITAETNMLDDVHEVVEYRDMVAIVRDRVKALVASGASLEQVLAAKVTTDYDRRYGANSGAWTTRMFVEAMYQSLKQQPRK